MPTHLKEEPMLLLRADDSELFKWVEERLESIGLDGKLYSRVIKSVLNGNLEQEEFELKMNSRRSRGHELLIKEILLASMWKGNDKSDDYWIFRKVIADFVNKYKSRGALATDAASSNESDASDERYEEAFPSLSGACDEVGWNVPRWTFAAETQEVGEFDEVEEAMMLERRGDDDDREEASPVDEHLAWRRNYRGTNRRSRRRKRTTTLPATRRNGSRRGLVGDDDDDLHVQTKRYWNDRGARGGKRHSVPGDDGKFHGTSAGRFVGEFASRAVRDQSKNWQREKLSSSNATHLLSDGDEAGSTTSHVSSNDDAPWKFETAERIPLEVLFPNLNYVDEGGRKQLGRLSDDRARVEPCASVPRGSEERPSRSLREDLVVLDLLVLPFLPEKLSGQSRVLEELKLCSRSYIPEYPWSSRSFESSDDLIPAKCWLNNEADDGDEDSNDDGGGRGDGGVGSRGGPVPRNYPQSPRPYFHPDPPSYAPFPWGLESNRWL